MNTNMQSANVPTSPWEKFHRWVRALDEALEVDPVAQLQFSVRDLNQKLQKLEAHVHRLETQANTQNE